MMIQSRVNSWHSSGILRNLYNDDDIGSLLQVIIWWAGLMRGAVSIALAFNQVHISVCSLEFMPGCLPVDARHTYRDRVSVFSLCR
jgi:hypothetical protein